MRRRALIFTCIILALLPVMLLREYTPSNELRYLNIVDEMTEGGHPFAMSDHSVPYADKPPLYFWLAALMKSVAGRHSMFLLTLLSFIPALVTAWVMDKWTEERLTPAQRSAATLMLFTTAYFLASSMVLRMDMLMCMFIVLSLRTFHRMYLNKKGARDSAGKIRSHEAGVFRRDSILLPVFVFLGIFSKGAVGILVPVVSIIVFLVSERDLRIGRYLGPRFWLIIAGLCALWFTGVYIDGGKEYFNNLVFHQTVGRAVNSFHHKEPFWYYLISYWYILAPWSLLIFVSLVMRRRGGVPPDTTGRLFVCTALSTFAMLSAISSKIAIYLLPAIPFFVYAAALQLRDSGTEERRGFTKTAAMRVATGFAAAVILLISAASAVAEPLLGEKVALPVLWAPYGVITLPLAIGGIVSFIMLGKRELTGAITAVTAALLTTFFLAGLGTKSVNPLIGAKDGSMAAAELAVGKNLELKYYKYDKMVNLDHYFKQKGLTISRIEMEQMRSGKNFILFFREKEIRRDAEFASFIKNFKYEKYGDNICVAVIE